MVLDYITFKSSDEFYSWQTQNNDIYDIHQISPLVLSVSGAVGEGNTFNGNIAVGVWILFSRKQKKIDQP